MLHKLQSRIEELDKKSREVGGWSRDGRIITKGWLKTGLRDRGITSHLDRGVPVPLDIFGDEKDNELYKNKVFYVWFDAYINT